MRSNLFCLVLVFLIIAPGCASKHANPPGHDQAANGDFIPTNIDCLGVSFSRPGKGWQLVLDDSQQKLWREEKTQTEFEFHALDGSLNPYVFRVDKDSVWTVINQQELQLEGLDNLAVLTHANKIDKTGYQVGTLELYFYRNLNSVQPMYFFISLRNYDFSCDDSYQDMFEIILNSLGFRQ